MRPSRGLWAVWALMLVGCMRPTQAVMEDVDPYGWQEAVCVEMENGDTTTLRDVKLLLRANSHFRNDSLPLQLTLIEPDSSFYGESVKFVMQHRRTVSALHRTDELPYRHRAKFRKRGTYHLIITPLEPVVGIEAVGINIIKSE